MQFNNIQTAQDIHCGITNYRSTECIALIAHKPRYKQPELKPRGRKTCVKTVVK